MRRRVRVRVAIVTVAMFGTLLALATCAEPGDGAQRLGVDVTTYALPHENTLFVVKLRDGTRCAVLDSYRSVGVACDWYERPPVPAP